MADEVLKLVVSANPEPILATFKETAIAGHEKLIAKVMNETFGKLVD